jgi:hypothetical protein
MHSRVFAKLPSPLTAYGVKDIPRTAEAACVV